MLFLQPFECFRVRKEKRLVLIEPDHRPVATYLPNPLAVDLRHAPDPGIAIKPVQVRRRHAVQVENHVSRLWKPIKHWTFFANLWTHLARLPRYGFHHARKRF
jgi:hypothetical protein